MPETIIALILRILSNPLANACQKKLSKNYSSILINFYSYFLMSMICIIPSFFVDWTKFTANFWFYVLLAGFLCTMGTVCLIKALSLGEMSVLGPINSYKCIIGLVTAFFLLGEIPSLISIIGLLLIVWGSWFIFDTVSEGFSWKLFLRRDIQLRFAALFMTGIEAAFLKKIIIMSSPQISFILWSFGGLLFSAIILIFARKPLLKIKKSDWKPLFTITAGLTTMQLSTNFVFNKMNVGLALALFQLSSIVGLFLGYKLFKEKNIIKKLIGTIIMIVGSAIILLY